MTNEQADTTKNAGRFDPIEVIRAEADRFAEVIATADAGARCPTCPDWSIHDLLWHLTEVHLFWSGILERGARTDEEMEAVEASKPPRPGDLAGLLALRAEATAALTDQLARLTDDEPRWTWWPNDQTVGFTRRMQTHEATMHRIDAELAAGVPVSPIEPAVAAAAVDHCVDVMWAYLPEWATYRCQAGLTLEATDTGHSWSVEVGRWTGIGPQSGNHFDRPRAGRATGEMVGVPRATVRAPLEQLARWAWSRSGTATIEGDDAAVAAIEALIEAGIE